MVEELSYDEEGDPEQEGPFQVSARMARRLGVVLAYDAWIKVLRSTSYTTAWEYIEP